jgi:uncharacterized iron-regulated membrane protein
MKVVRSIIFWLHLTVGFVAGLVILVMSVTGLLLAFERQINAYADAPVVLQGESDSSPHVSLESALVLLKNDGQGIPDQLVLHRDSSAPIEARYGRDRTLFLNPWTAEIVGQPSQRTREFFSTVEQFHRSLGLGMRSALGREITGAGNLVFLFLLLSGIYLWMPRSFSRASLTTRWGLRGGLQGKGREWNWHHVVGFWTAVPLLFVVVTGVVISYPWASNLLFSVTGTRPPARGWRGGSHARQTARNATSAPGSSVAPAQFGSIDDATTIAKQQISAWKTITIDVPDPQDRTIRTSIDTSAGGQPDKVSQVTINRQSGRVEAVKRFSGNNAGSKLRAWARFTHTGEEFGLPGQIIAALACLGAMLLVWTGLSMAVRRAFAAADRLLSRSSTLEPEIATGSGAMQHRGILSQREP